MVREAGWHETAAAIEAAAYGGLPDLVVERIIDVIAGIAESFIVTHPERPREWRFVTVDLQDRLGWWTHEGGGAPATTTQTAARNYILETTVPHLRATSRPETADSVEQAARGDIPESVAERIGLVVAGTAGAFISTPPGEPHGWRLFVTDTQNRITWWNGEETG